KLGLSARVVQGPYEALPSVPLPTVVPVKTEEGRGHFVVLHRHRKHSVVVADPARGVVKLSREEFCTRWTGRAVVMVPDPHVRHRRGGAPAGPLAQSLSLLAPHAHLLWEAALCALVLTGLGVSGSFFLRHLVDSVLARRDTQMLNALGIGAALLLLFRFLFG